MLKTNPVVSESKNHTAFSQHIQNAISTVSQDPQELSIVLFRIAADAPTRDLSLLIDSEIQNHMRATDSVGWLDKDHLAFVLPETGSDGAAELLRRLAGTTALSHAAEDYWVISYPRSTCAADAVVDYERFPG